MTKDAPERLNEAMAFTIAFEVLIGQETDQRLAGGKPSYTIHGATSLEWSMSRGFSKFCRQRQQWLSDRNEQGRLMMERPFVCFRSDIETKQTQSSDFRKKTSPFLAITRRFPLTNWFHLLIRKHKWIGRERLPTSQSLRRGQLCDVSLV